MLFGAASCKVRIASKYWKAEVAQLVEQLIRNQQVAGSSPAFGSIYIFWHLQEKQGVAWF